MREVRVSVRRLVEFLLRSGDIDAGSTAGELDAMQLGSDVHRRLQAMAEGPYQAEVPLARSFYFPQGQLVEAALRMDVPPEAVGESDPTGWFLRVEGRADGVIDVPRGVAIDEIKGTYADVAEMDGPREVHVAQARCYAYLYLRDLQAKAGDATFRRNDPVTVRMTYVGLDTGEVRRFEQALWFQELEGWFLALLAGYHRWLGPRQDHLRRRDEALRQLAFPFPWRPGQEDLADRVGRTVRQGGRLYLQAPTGSGKTVACLWPALRAMGEGQGERLAYLTAKTVARQAAVDCLDLLNGKDARVVAVALTAREKICPLRQGRRDTSLRGAGRTTPCNPVECPYARGHFDRIGQVAHDLLEAAEGGAVLGRAKVLAAAAQHRVCPYELQLELADWADAVVCDYNYVFRPSSTLRCLGDDPKQAILLLDEAHNLVDRARDLYSAELVGASFARAAAALEREGRGVPGGLVAALRRVASWLGHGRPRLEGGPVRLRDGRKGARAGGASGGQASARAAGRAHGRAGGSTAGWADEQRPSYRVVKDFGRLPGLLEAAVPLMDKYLAEAPASEQVRDPYVLTVELRRQTAAFLSALERSDEDERYVLYLEELEGGNGRRAKAFCSDPSGEVGERLAAVRASVLLSATLIPEDYYRTMLAAREDDASYRATSCFEAARQLVLVGRDVSMRFSRRGHGQYRRVATYVRRMVEARAGNYLVFLPSYAVLGAVRDQLGEALPAGTRVLAQRPGMGEREREGFLEAFRTGGGRALPGRASRPGDLALAGRASGGRQPSLVGLCVLGGFFAESVDLRGDALVGVAIVGTGLPGVGTDREIVRRQFDEADRDGFAYAYSYPGWAKVLQAAGRLIRSEEDAGVVLLLDERFATTGYGELFPEEWGQPAMVTQDSVASQLARFWAGL